MKIKSLENGKDCILEIRMYLIGTEELYSQTYFLDDWRIGQ
jgi:hypothetical protein